MPCAPSAGRAPGWRMEDTTSFKANQDDSGLLKYARPAARHDGGASKRLKRAEMAALDREYDVDRCKAAAAPPGSCRTATAGGLDRRLGGAGPVGGPVVC